MNMNLNNLFPIRRGRIALAALVLTALMAAAPWLTTVAYACQSQGGGC